MSDIDPGLAIVLTTLGLVAAMLALAWRRRRAAKARMAALREAERVELEIVSQLRVSVVLLGIFAPVVFGAPFVAMALGEWGRAHALGFVIVFIVFVGVTVIAVTSLPPSWARVGQLVLDGDTLRVESLAARSEIDLAREWSLQEGLVPPGRSTEMLVQLVQGEVRLTLRYPLLFGDEAFAQGAPIVAPSGVLLGPEARVVHERLRERAMRAA